MAKKRKDNRDLPEAPKKLTRREGRPVKNRIGLPEDVHVMYDGETNRDR